jgi:hypothetical protein
LRSQHALRRRRVQLALRLTAFVGKVIVVAENGSQYFRLYL